MEKFHKNFKGLRKKGLIFLSLSAMIYPLALKIKEC